LKSMKYAPTAVCILLLFVPGCKLWNTAITTIDKDIPIQEQDALEEKYIGETAWTRALIVDIGNNGVIDRGTEVEIVELDLHWKGAVGVKGPNNHKYRHALNLERPLTREKFEVAVNRLFWFDKPSKRYRMNLRKYGKRTARAIRDEELFRGMPREAAIESWGYPDEMRETDIGGEQQEQWIYIDPRQQNRKSYIWLVSGEVDRWEE